MTFRHLGKLIVTLTVAYGTFRLGRDLAAKVISSSTTTTPATPA